MISTTYKHSCSRVTREKEIIVCATDYVAPTALHHKRMLTKMATVRITVSSKHSCHRYI